MSDHFNIGLPSSFTALAAIAGAISLAVLMSVPAEKAQPTVETLDECFIAEPENTPPPGQDCGFVAVPENPDQPGGPEIKLAFHRLPANSADPKAPMFMLAGGPGDTFIKPETLRLFGDAFLGPMLADRDVVLLDQRGKRNAIPRLDCREVYGLPRITHVRGLERRQTRKPADRPSPRTRRQRPCDRLRPIGVGGIP